MTKTPLLFKEILAMSCRCLADPVRRSAVAVLIALAGGLAAVPLASAAPAQTPPPVALSAPLVAAVALHDAAVAGDRAAAQAARQALAALVAAEPGNAVALAYLGSVHSLLARDAPAFNVVSRTVNVNTALRHLDKALELAPQDVTVRMVRANVNWNLPAMFDRRKDAVEDMIALDALFRAAPRPALAREMRQIYRRLSEAAPDRGNWAAGAALARDLAAER